MFHMLFFCFTIKDRMPLIDAFNQYISNFGLDTWYDRRNIFLGDNRIQENIEKGVKNLNLKYAIIFYSNNFEKGNICLQEYEILLNRYKAKEITIFPVFMGDVPDKLYGKFSLLKNLVYKRIDTFQDFFPLALHIISKIIYDELKIQCCKSIKDYLSTGKNNLATKLFTEYENIDKKNYMRCGYLFCMFKVFNETLKTSYLHFKTMHFLFYKNCITPIAEEKRELQIMENIVLLNSIRLFPCS